MKAKVNILAKPHPYKDRTGEGEFVLNSVW